MTFVIFHGSFSNPEDHWFLDLKEDLEALGQKVLLPKFPTDDWNVVTKNGPSKPLQNQSLSNWLFTFDRLRQQFSPSDKLCFIGHSMGPLFILHAVSKYNIRLDSAIFVSPFLTKLNKSWQIDHANKTFYKDDFDFEKLRLLIPKSYTLYSDNDPYVPQKYSLEFAHKMKSRIIRIKDGGHFNSENNYTKFPFVFELCRKLIGS